jgi:hypothetical protein
MDKKLLREMIIRECGCMAREAELPATMGAALPMLDILGFGGDMGRDMPTHAKADGIQYEDSDEYEESGMIKDNLYNIVKHAKALHDALEDGDDLPEWVQEKIAVVNSMMSTVYDYLDAESAHMHEAKKAWYMKKRRNMKKANESEWYDIPKGKKKKLKKV